MQPADDHIMIMLCSQPFMLKASLRAAYCLNMKYRGFGNLAKAITEGSFTAYQDVIKAGCTDPTALNAFLKPFHDTKIDVTPLGESILANRHELLEFVLILSGAKREHEGDARPHVGKAMTIEEYHNMLFKLGAGALGWSPEDTWEASAIEIIEAYRGRREMLAAIFGGGEKQSEASRDDLNDLNAIGDLTNNVMPCR